ncbi:MAG: phage holin family protein [Alphaproteobacteria bacterium]
MSSFVGILQGIALDKLLKTEPPFFSKVKIGLGLIALSGFFILCGLGFIVFAAHLWFRTQFTPEISYALTGLIFIGFGLIGCWVTYALAQYHKRIFRKFKNDITETIESLFELLDEELKEPISENPKAAVLLASLGGYVAGKKLL